MSAHGLEVIDHTVQETHEWINELRDRVDWPSHRDALRLLRTVLHQIRDRLPLNEAVQLAAQMPALLRGFYYEGWQPSRTPMHLRHIDHFFAAVEEKVGAVSGYRGEQDIISVFKTINARISRGEVEDVRSNLPSGIRDLWPDP